MTVVLDHYVWVWFGRRQQKTRSELKDECSLRAYCVSLHFANSVLFLVLFFFKLKVCGNSVSSKFIGTISPPASTHFESVCQIWVTLTTFQTFSLLLYYADL